MIGGPEIDDASEGGWRVARSISAPRAAVLGVPCFHGTLDQATQFVVQAALGGAGGYACLCNVHVLETAQRHTSVMVALKEALVVFPDGAPIAWLQRFEHNEPAARIGGPDLMERVVHDGCEVALRHALYGSTPLVLRRLEESLRGRYPNVQIVASIAPPHDGCDGDVEADLEALRAAQPHVVWVALGAPRQELWAARHAPVLSPAVVIGVGAAFDFLSGQKPRAPRWMQSVGIEWFHRLATEPRRLGRRYATTNTRFMLRAIAGVARHGLGRRDG